MYMLWCYWYFPDIDFKTHVFFRTKLSIYVLLSFVLEDMLVRINHAQHVLHTVSSQKYRELLMCPSYTFFLRMMINHENTFVSPSPTPSSRSWLASWAPEASLPSFIVCGQNWWLIGFKGWEGMTWQEPEHHVNGSCPAVPQLQRGTLGSGMESLPISGTSANANRVKK